MELVSKRLKTEIGELLVAAGPKGICRISFPAGLSGKWYPWFDRYFSKVPRRGNHPIIQELEYQIREYLVKNRRSFDLPIDLRGTEFQIRVWKRLLEIPYGSISTYGEIAKEMGLRGGGRAVGNASAANPIPIVIPCHRLVGHSGHLVGFGGGLELKEYLLELEGNRIRFPEAIQPSLT
jgi:O-6-methylguanine DNA methyltransferase